MTQYLSIAPAFALQQQIRKDLLKQGYRPLPTAEKVAFQKGWPTQHIDAGVIDTWPMTVSRGRKSGRVTTVPAVTTAIQLEGTMLAIDVDVQDTGVSDDIYALIFDAFGEEKFLVRNSGGAKFMALVQTETPYKIWRSPKYIDPDGKDHAVEVFGGGTTRYFSCFGPHTLGPVTKGEYPILKEYVWEQGKSPLNVASVDLELISEDALNELMMRINDRLAEATKQGWEIVKAPVGEMDGGTQYDINPDMTFDTPDGRMGYEEALGYAFTNEDARCSGSFLDGVSGNVTRCRMMFMGSYDDPALGVFDHESWVMYLPEEAAPQTDEERTEKLEALGETLRDSTPNEVFRILEEAEDAGARTDAFMDTVEKLMAGVVFNTVTGLCHYVKRGLVQEGVKLATLKLAYKQYEIHYKGPRGGTKSYSPVDAWLLWQDRLDVSGTRFDPRAGHIIERSGLHYVNQFFGLPDPQPVSQSDTALLHRFMTHLVPGEEERAWLWQWLAAKYQQPWSRNCAVMFLAENVQGTGRGLLFSILNRTFDRYTSTVSEADLISGRFNGYLEKSLLVFCNEVGGGKFTDRKKGYETLKDRVDPSHTQVNIEHKGVSSYMTETFTSFVLASNNANALVLDAEDRRFAVVSNGKKLGGALGQELFDADLDVLANAMASILQLIPVHTELHEAPHFSGRNVMLNANSTELDDAIATEIENASPNRSWIRSDFEKAIKLRMTGSDMRPVPGLRQAVSNLTGVQADRVGATLMREKLKVASHIETGFSAHAIVTKNTFHFSNLTPEARRDNCSGTNDGQISDNIIKLKN